MMKTVLVMRAVRCQIDGSFTVVSIPFGKGFAQPSPSGWRSFRDKRLVPNSSTRTRTCAEGTVSFRDLVPGNVTPFFIRGASAGTVYGTRLPAISAT